MRILATYFLIAAAVWAAIFAVLGPWLGMVLFVGDAVVAGLWFAGWVSR